MQSKDARRRLVHHVNRLEELDARRRDAVEKLKGAFETAALEGYDTATLKAVLKLRKLTPAQRLERRALEAIYLAAIGLLDGDALPDEARRRLSGDDKQRELPDITPATTTPETHTPSVEQPQHEHQPTLALKDPAEARQEGADAAAAGKRIYDNPYAAGDPCRAAWDEGWCGQRNSHGMDVPQAYQRRPAPSKPPKKDDGKDDVPGKAA